MAEYPITKTCPSCAGTGTIYFVDGNGGDIPFFWNSKTCGDCSGSGIVPFGFFVADIEGIQGIQGIQGEVGPPGAAGLGYNLHVQALTSSPVDAQTVYFGQLPKAPITTANVSKVYVRKAGTIKVAEIYCYSGTAGTAEAWSLYIRKNNTADTLIATMSVAANERLFENPGLNIAVVVGDYIEIKAVNPTWATNPLTCIFGGYLYIE